MSFDTSFARNVDESNITELTTGESFPIIQYGYGDSRYATKNDDFDSRGGFFINAERLGAEGSPERKAYHDGLIAAGWMEDTLTLQSGKRLDGYYKFDVEIALIHWRRRWEAGNRGSNDLDFYPFPLSNAGFETYKQLVNEYDSVRGRIQCMVSIRGMEDVRIPGSDLPPVFVLSLKGISQVMMTKDFMPLFNKHMVQTFSQKMGGKAFPLRLFYMHISPTVDADGANVFSEVGRGKETSMICRPSILGLPELGDEQAIDQAWQRYFVGNKLVEKGKDFDQLWLTHQDWASAWDKLDENEKSVRNDEAENEETGATEDDVSLISAANI